MVHNLWRNSSLESPGRVATYSFKLPGNSQFKYSTGRSLFSPEIAVEEVFTRVQNRFSPDSEQRKDGPFSHRKYPD